MIELPLSDEAEQFGRHVKANYDQAGVKDHWQRRPGYDKRWTGYAVEFALDEWLSEEGIPHVWNGGLDNKPDFVVGPDPGLAMAVKSNSGDRPRDDFVFAVAEHHVHKLASGALFCLVAVRAKKIWVAGYIEAKMFRQIAERRKKGDEGFLRGRPIEYDCRLITAGQLEPAERIFEMLRRCAA